MNYSPAFQPGAGMLIVYLWIGILLLFSIVCFAEATILRKMGWGSMSSAISTSIMMNLGSVIIGYFGWYYLWVGLFGIYPFRVSNFNDFFWYAAYFILAFIWSVLFEGGVMSLMGKSRHPKRDILRKAFSANLMSYGMLVFLFVAVYLWDRTR